MSEKVKTTYTNLSNEVLIKKINTYIKQIDEYQLFIKNNNSDYEYKKIDNLKEDMSRVDLEHTCNIITECLNKLKIEKTNILKSLEEHKKMQEKIIINYDDENYEDKKIDYPLLVNLEELKRSFFSPDNEEYRPFNDIIKENNFIYYRVNYKYSSDMCKRPDYMALNLNNGFVQRFEDYKKYLFVCFRCFQYNDDYEYVSYWLYNSTENINIVLKNEIEDFQFEEIKMIEFVKNFNKMDKNLYNLINEKYLH
jgi:hypothetical protein